MILQHNMLSLNSARQLGITNNKLGKNMERLSSGYRVNRASDDAAGLSISEKMRGQIRGLEQGAENIQDGISMIQTAEGAMGQVQDMLQRIRELYVANCNDTNTEEDRESNYKECVELMEEIGHIAEYTEFNNKKLLNGDWDNVSNPPGNHYVYDDNGLFLQVGSNSNQSVKFSIPDFRVYSDDNHNVGADIFAQDRLYKSDASGVLPPYDSLYTLFRRDDAAALKKFQSPWDKDINGWSYQELTFASIDYSIEKVSEARATIGAMQNRLEHALTNNSNTAENLQAAESRIRDANLAGEMMDHARNNILLQANQSVLTQSNRMAEGVLKLLQM